MAKLYPPFIEGTIPAFSGYRIPIPFIMNKTVSWGQVAGFYLKIKSIQTNETILTKRVDIEDCNQEDLCVYFDISYEDIDETGESVINTKLRVGASYKVQLAYIDITDTIGYYSTVGVVKYTTTPKVEIVDLQQGYLHANINTYLGKYSQENQDVSEKIYSYCFTVYNPDGSIMDTTGTKLHNHENDDEIYESIDTYIFNKTLEEDKVYTIQYTGVTSNGMTISSPRYRITQITTVKPEIKAEVMAEMNEENGYVNISLLGNNDDSGHEVSAVGTFVLCRSSSEDNFKNWYEIQRFALLGERPSTFQCRDFTVAHGYDYQYSLQQYNVDYGIYSNRVLSNVITANFEYNFLYDGERQLKIKFNPKISSFKEVLQESKTTTLGSKFPYFYRNGNVAYKEFPINGLISYQMDNDELFLSNEDMKLYEYEDLKREHTLKSYITSEDDTYFQELNEITENYNYVYNLQEEYKKRERSSSNENLLSNMRPRTTQLTDYNILAERIFKTNVLNWLNDGKPKLFRSPTEGNFLVRLMNSSLTPNDVVGRVLHTFATTATEVDYSDYDTLNKYGIVSISEPDTTQLHWKTLIVRDIVNNHLEDANEDGWISLGNIENIYSIDCINMPYNKIMIESGLGTSKGLQQQEIHIGVTGGYSIRFNEPPNRILIHKDSAVNNISDGQIIFSYKGKQLQKFDTYRMINMADYPVRQFIGRQTDVFGNDIDIKDTIEDIKTKVSKYYFANFTKRPVATVTKQNNTYYINGVEAGENFVANPLYIYYENGKYYDGREYIPSNMGTDTDIDINYKIYIDGKEIDIEKTQYFQISNFDHLPKIVLSTGVVADVSIQCRQIEYDVELYRKSDISNKYYYIDERIAYEEQLAEINSLIRPTTQIDYYLEYLYANRREYLEKLHELEDRRKNGEIESETEYLEEQQRIIKFYEEQEKIYLELQSEFEANYENILKLKKQTLKSLYQRYLLAIENKLKDKGVKL